MVAIILHDLFSQVHYLRGALFTVPEISNWSPWLGTAIGIAALAWKPARRIGILLLALLHYATTYIDGPFYTAADGWVWLMAFSLACIPDDGDSTHDYWVGILKLTGFLVYLFAGLNKAIHKEWWNGEAMQNVFLDPTGLNEKYLFLADWPVILMIIGWCTIAERLIVPWGFWARNELVRRISAGIMVVMHYTYMMALNIGNFPWVGCCYLSLFFFPNNCAPEKYYAWPPRKNKYSLALAALFTAYLVAMPMLSFSEALGWKKPGPLPRLPGIDMRWNMFAAPGANIFLPVYSVRTCSGKELTEDEVFWSFGNTDDYPRRRFSNLELTLEFFDPNRIGPVEKRLLANFPEKIAARRVKAFLINKSGKELRFDTQFQDIGDCSGHESKK